MKLVSLLFVTFMFPKVILAQQIINVATQYIEINTPFIDSIYPAGGDITYEGHVCINTSGYGTFYYCNDYFNHGLHFKNNTTTYIVNNIKQRTETDTNCSNWNTCNEVQWWDSPIIGVHGKGTKLVFKGSLFKADNTRSYPVIALSDSGHFVFSKECKVDLVFNRWDNFTRNLYVTSADGTGIFEIEDGFNADLSNGGTTNISFGACRFNRSTFISHNSASLPHYYRPILSDPDGYAKINSHLVFEENPGSKWITLTNPQVFPGGVWINENMSLITEKDLFINGRIAKFNYNEYYVNYNGMMFLLPNKTVTKSGKGSLILMGDQAYESGSSFIINEGNIDFVTDPYMFGIKTFTESKTFNTAKNLNITLNNASTIIITSKSVNLKSITVNSDSATLKIKLGSKLDASNSSLKGTLELIIPNDTILQPGRVVTIANWGIQNGTFSSIRDSGNKYSWDISNLYMDGTLKVIQLISSIDTKKTEKPCKVISSINNTRYIDISINTTIFNHVLIDLIDINGRVLYSDDLSLMQQHTMYSLDPELLNNKLLIYKIYNENEVYCEGKIMN